MLEHVTDQIGSRYTLGRCIGTGGQGSVYELKEGKLAVKLLHRNGDPEILRRRIEQVKRYDFSGIPLARPKAILRPPLCGYIMELVSGAKGLQSMLRPDDPNSDPSRWYIASGGLRGRLRVLGRLARVLSVLHGRSLAYGDLSPANVAISGDPLGEFTLHLLDCDNIRSESLPSAPAVYTPGYGAPELVAGTGAVNTLSDLYAFAVLAFECLSTVHPFVGDSVDDGEPELEEKAFAGELPWIEDQGGTNRSSRGVPRDWLLTPRFRTLFAQAFGAGKSSPAERPRASTWAESLEQAADMTLHCPHCRATYYLPKEAEICPWCGQSVPLRLTVHMLLWDPAHKRSGARTCFVTSPGTDKLRVLGGLMLTANVPHRVERRHLALESIPGCIEYEPLASLCYDPRTKQCEVCNLTDEPLRISRHEPGKPEKILAKGDKVPVRLAVPGQPPCDLHFGPENQLHRALRISN